MFFLLPKEGFQMSNEVFQRKHFTFPTVCEILLMNSMVASNDKLVSPLGF